MEIKLNVNNDLLARAVQRQPQTAPISPVRDEAAFENLAALDRRLVALPVVRPETIARGQELLSVADYPPEKTIESIAQLLALHWPDGADRPA